MAGVEGADESLVLASDFFADAASVCAETEGEFRPCFHFYCLGKCRTSKKRCRNQHHLTQAEFETNVTADQLLAQLELRQIPPERYAGLIRTDLLRLLTKTLNPKRKGEKDESQVHPDEASFRKKRRHLFSKFEQGVQIPDTESWYSITPEAVAKQIASLCGCFNGTVLDGFAGVGGNTVQFAAYGAQVLSVEINAERAACCKVNCEVYGVCSRVEVVCSDLFHMLPRAKADIVFLSPPWGGPSYKDSEVYQPDQLILDSFRRALSVAPSVAVYLPRQTERSFIDLAAGEAVTRWVRHNTKDGHQIAQTVFVGPVCDRVGALYCDACELVCTSAEQLTAHVSGKKHKLQCSASVGF